MPNHDLPLPPDVFAILEANKGFHKQPCTLPSALKSSSNATVAPQTLLPTSSSPLTTTNNHINMPEIATSDENPIEFDPSPKPLQKTPKRLGAPKEMKNVYEG